LGALVGRFVMSDQTAGTIRGFEAVAPGRIAALDAIGPLRSVFNWRATPGRGLNRLSAD
jgi:hypothetical protein